MLHEKFDIERFKKMFPLSQLREEAKQFVLTRQQNNPSAYASAEAVEKHIQLMEPHGENITGPYHAAVLEQLREEAAPDPSPEVCVPTDVCIFAIGEPTDSRCTKIGGIPFWPKNREWPKRSDGKSLDFVAQFNFTDSKTLFDKLPGDLLLIFSEPIEEGKSLSSSTLNCEWINTEKELPADTDTFPNTKNRLIPLYAVLHRTCDYFDIPPEFQSIRRGSSLTRIEGTKMGGLPNWIQADEKLPGQFLCSLGSILPKQKRPFPYVNVEKPVGFREAHDKGLLMWGDVGCVYFFLNSDGAIHWTDQCY